MQNSSEAPETLVSKALGSVLDAGSQGRGRMSVPPVGSMPDHVVSVLTNAHIAELLEAEELSKAK
jgi:hypothetical protein